MEQPSPSSPPLRARDILEAQIRESFGRVVYSHKTHEKCGDILLSRLAGIKLWQMILSAVTTGGFVAAIMGAGTAAAVAGAVVSTALLILNAYTKNYDLGALAQKHKETACDLWLVRERLQSLLADLLGADVALVRLQERRDTLTEDLHAIYKGAPSTSSQAYRQAQQALKYNEDMTFSPDEINAFLPEAMKKH